MKKFNRIFGTAATVAALLFSLTILSCSSASDGPNVLPPAPALSVPLTLEAAEAGAVVTFDNKAAGPVTYKVNGGTAQTIASGATGTITLSAIGDKAEFFGDNKSYATSNSNYSHIACDKDCYVYGNIMSLVKNEGFKDVTELKQTYTFSSLFKSNAHIKNKSGAPLLLPATTLAGDCYNSMFQDCASLTAAPDLPATSLADCCYGGMFYNCASLASAPELPATSLADCCYSTMFYGCTSLASAPELPATSLADYCYGYMFYGCKSLTAAPSLPAATLADECYSSMFRGCASLTAAPSLPATTLAYSCYAGMFRDCASLTAAPSLPAATLADDCYYYMFRGCTKLSSVTCLATDISAENCTKDWLDGVAASGTFTKAAGATWPEGSSGIPNGWNV
ncbi:MAG: leucine-rich repeat protein, partial [Treponema sp.]|nr:leucine-rich repeat protein [Treponema sp.]